MFFDIKTFFFTLFDLCVQYKERVLLGIGLGIVFYVVHRLRLRNVPIKTSSNELGELFVTRNAIIYLINDVSAAMHLGQIMRIKLFDKKNLLRIKLYVRLYANQSFDAVSMEFQQRIQQSIAKCLGIVKNVRVDVILHSMEKIKSSDDDKKVTLGE